MSYPHQRYYREAYASKLLAGGTPVGTIAAALGHVGVGTVLNEALSAGI